MDYVIREKAEAVVATGGSHFNGHADMAFLTIYFPNNVLAHINVNWLSPVKVRTTLIGGRDKMLVWNDLEADEKIKVYDKGVTVTSKEGVYDLLVSYRSGDVWAPKVDQTEALKAELAYFLDCITSGTTPFNDGEAGLRVVRMLEAADRSLAERGKVVPLTSRRTFDEPRSRPRRRSRPCHPLVEYFRCPEHLAVLGTADPLPPEAGYFRFGDAICYGRQGVGPPSPRPDGSLVDVSRGVSSANGKVLLPFDLSEVLDNLRHERYPEAQRAIEHISSFSLSHAAYYFFRPVLPVAREEAPPAAPLEGMAEHPVSRGGPSTSRWRR